MTDAREFLEAFREAARSLGSWRLLTPTEVVGSWRGFVEQCEEGYADSIFEFHNDLSVRTLIMKLLEHPALLDYEQMGWVERRLRPSTTVTAPCCSIQIFAPVDRGGRPGFHVSRAKNSPRISRSVTE